MKAEKQGIIDFQTPEERIVPREVGGKFYHLYRLNKRGRFHVPPAFCIPAPDFSEEEVLSRIRRDTAYAVRSSAPVEDLPGQSAAGLFTTFLNIRGEEALLRAIRQCFASPENERVLAYLEKMRGEARRPDMHVMVQEMIEPDTSGVLFTVQPVTGERRMIVEMVEGVGDRLTAGNVEPERYVFARDEVPEDAFLRDLVRLGKDVEDFFGTPQDIEWGLSGGRIFLLQARPVVPAGKALSPEIVWTRANIGEIIPEPLTPLSWSVFEKVIFSSWRNSYYSIPDRIITNMTRRIPLRRPAVRSPASFHGILYLNMDTVLHTFSVEPWVDAYILQRGLGFPGGMVQSAKKRSFPGTMVVFLKALLFLAEFIFPFLSFEKRGASRVRKDPGKSPEKERFEALKNRCAALFGWHLAATSRSFSCLGFVRSLLRLLYRDQGQIFNSLLNRVSAERIDPHVKDLDLLRQCAKNGDCREQDSEAREMSVFLEKYGHRSQNEFELRQPSWREDPGELFTLLRTPVEKKSEHPDRELSFFPRFLARRLAASIMLREEMKSMLVKAYRKFRPYYLEKAKILVARGILRDIPDVFFLTAEEVEACLQKETKEPLPVKARKQAFHEAAAGDFPETFFGDFAWDDAVPTAGRELLFGISCSAGKTTGRAIILDSPDEGKKLAPGDILVARAVDPGWTPLFSSVSGVVTEIGGILSHAATVAREYRIPYIAGVENAKKKISEGTMVTLDGDNGMVFLREGED